MRRRGGHVRSDLRLARWALLDPVAEREEQDPAVVERFLARVRASSRVEPLGGDWSPREV